ncbi:hypothetical protein MMC11_007222 [Xylographa trunciseda]|nr:hypothetical protein [Xylographa trunciseda]
MRVHHNLDLKSAPSNLLLPITVTSALSLNGNSPTYRHPSHPSSPKTLEGQMFAHAVPSSPAVSTNPPPASPTGPSRPSRLRGLSYLRNYTQQHLSLHSQQPASPPLPRNSLLRSISYPAPTQQPTSPSGEASEPPFFDNNNENPDQIAEEPPGIGDPDCAGGSVAMARKRSGSSQAGSQAPATRRGQSVPPAIPNADARILSRLARTTSSNEPSTTTTPISAHGGASEASGLSGLPQDQMPTIKFIPHQDPRSGKPSLSFPTTSRTLPHEDCVIRVGRYSERDGQPNPPPNQPSSAPVGFKSKVVSRRHCEFWCSQGQWYIKDVKSSSGTFLNHIRLSQPSVESRPFPVNDGDVVQLGIDFRGGEEMIFRCVKIRVECNRAWQKSLNNFNMTTHKRLRALGKHEVKKDSDTASMHSSECAICLMSIAPCQSLFVAPCSHVWHYKCIRPMLNDHRTWPQFMCPNCRAMADLEADVDDPLDEWHDDEDEDADINVDSEQNFSHTTSNSDPKSNGTEVPILSNVVSAHESVYQDLPSRSRQLSNTNITDEHPSTISPSNQPTPSSGPSLISRRLASRPSFGVVDEVPGHEDSNMSIDIAANQSATPQSRPITPRTASGLRTPTSAAGEVLDHVGPLTPRNDAGPFVFDGSAGRSAGRRMLNGSEGTSSEE